MQKTRKTYYANGTDIGDAMIHRGIYYLNGAEVTTQDWDNMPSDWSDIRKDCPANSIALYAGVKSDYSQYDNLGFTATCTGGYKVYIDGTQYGSTYASGSTCSITWSTSGITTGDDITTPTALKAHKIWIEPATEGNNITIFQCASFAGGSVVEYQGILWAHFNLTNAIRIAGAFAFSGSTNKFRNLLLKAFTAKNNLVTYSVNSADYRSGFQYSFYDCQQLEYLPIFKAESQEYPSGTYAPFSYAPVKKIVIKNNKGTEGFALLNNCRAEEINVENGLKLATTTAQETDARNAINLKKFPKINQNKGENFQMFNCPNLEPVNIDDRFNDIRKLFRFYGTASVPTPALKSLRVSNQAPFDGATPQINVSYTGLDRNALVQLFNDLPYNVGYEVVGSPTITDGVASGFSNDDYIKITHPGSFSVYTKPVCIIQRFKTPISAPSIDYNLYTDTVIRVIINSSSFLSVVLYGQSGKYKWFANNPKLQLDTLYDFKVEYDGIGKTDVYYKLASAENFTFMSSIENFPLMTDYVWNTLIGRANWNNLNIDLNNTYIKVNYVYWFRGQPAMTKTLSCVGATGTADLTAEDKDIALSKGWSLTLS